MSRRDVQLPTDGGVVRVGDSMFEISFGSMPPEVVAAELRLLVDGLVPGISLRHPKQETKVRVLASDVQARARAAVSEHSLELAVSRTELLAWISFFLRYYRDGVAEVDHLDLEAELESDHAASVDVCLRVADFKPPVGEDEARKRLGLSD